MATLKGASPGPSTFEQAAPLCNPHSGSSSSSPKCTTEQSVEPTEQPMLMSRIVCKGAGLPPRIALLISGGFRALTLPLVYYSFKQNVIDALGTQPTVFMYLKVNQAEPSLSQEAVALMLKVTGIPRKHVVMLNESAPVKLAECPRYKIWPRGNPTDRHHRLEWLVHIVAQLENRAESTKLIEEHERRTSKRFHWVFYARPDLLWYEPVRPWCFISATSRGFTQIISRHDYAFLLPRELMPVLLQSPYYAYMTCKKDITPGKIIE
eukprot:CAMPEP_0174697130 /NCGR_PEP_ID=MMETSP1094-20130205/3079_1 /TAXON_ID=156173 /ORGANISM="Chrysochromulina brevifilum, Strain UTEX LB 985" /LENGTH=264 /DNA_ID=CAMNT_0015894049 /DNA_START=120 /DNA_END=914 /DNA_ORIENTATION=-